MKRNKTSALNARSARSPKVMEKFCQWLGVSCASSRTVPKGLKHDGSLAVDEPWDAKYMSNPDD
eukprot:4579478-Amphidinium_carterae.1